jgi:acetolactate synthase-1/2/3 large subunit
MGIESLTIASIDALEQVEFDELFARQGPTLIDVKIDPEEEPPMGERIKGLATSK